MKQGKILAYSPDVSAGVIECQAGKKYRFSITDWLSSRLPAQHMRISFEATPTAAVKVQAIAK